MADTKTPRAPTDKEAFFFLTIMQCMTNKPEVDWNMVATRAGYSNANCAKVRFGQIKKAIGYKEDGSHPPTTTPTKGRGKKDTNVGSGTNTTPTKVTKPRAPRKPKVTKAKVKAEPGTQAEVEEEDEKFVDAEAGEVAEEEADAYTFDNALHEQLYNNYQQYQNGHHEDEEEI
ncbi:hypothetical protein ONS95_010621 [Cadophora gregata]|uniref:uncharacterized protein n=1 Tax=Cadophora gregata TaxID=51156 RepID=UPI0026DCB341|nr:uncharacterized protein ONS95_010621 [Cadophora gregata]KAK0122381.1 hypothetical protein ONS95_010621 [Cadophora gregata]KAK0127859.1 hypothetical protein ONS96_007360 [Cadophora gregata f. sp. sojae]